MTTISNPTPWWTQAVIAAAVVALLLLPAGALGTRYGYWDYPVGFLVITTGVILAGIAFAGGGAIVVAGWKFGLPTGRWLLVLGMLLALVPLVLIGYQVKQARSLPAIHDITTDTEDPPAFERAHALRGPSANPLAYDAPANGPLQRQAYPHVQPLVVALPPGQSYLRSLEVLRAMGLEIVAEDPARGLIEAVATTYWFGFKDDLMVRVRPEGTGSRIDLRSVSRVGRSDLGANAARIGEFLRRFDPAAESAAAAR